MDERPSHDQDNAHKISPLVGVNPEVPHEVASSRERLAALALEIGAGERASSGAAILVDQVENVHLSAVRSRGCREAKRWRDKEREAERLDGRG